MQMATVYLRDKTTQAEIQTRMAQLREILAEHNPDISVDTGKSA